MEVIGFIIILILYVLLFILVYSGTHKDKEFPKCPHCGRTLIPMDDINGDFYFMCPHCWNSKVSDFDNKINKNK